MLGRDRWEELAPPFHDAQIAERKYCSPHCVQYARFLEADAHVQSEGLMLKSKRGSGRYNPYVGLSNAACENMLKLARQLGLTPASRKRVVRVRNVGASPAAKFLKTR